MAETFLDQGMGGRQAASSHLDKTSEEVIGAGSGVAALCGLGAAVLGIVGLSGLLPIDLCAVGVIAAGAGMVFEGGAVAARFRDVRAAAAADAGRKGEAVVETGMTTEMVGGLAAIVLGILALVHIATLTLLSVSAIVLGATLLLGTGWSYEGMQVPATGEQSGRAASISHKAAATAAGADVLMGLGAVTLGILGVIGIADRTAPTLALIALLVVGVAELISDSTLAARMTSVFRHH